jgi:hypothetical protein
MTVFSSTSASDDASNIFRVMRDGFAFVAERAVHVRINYDRLDAYVKTLPQNPPANVFDRDNHFIGTNEQTAAFVMILDALNFGSGYKPYLKKEGFTLKNGSLYFTVANGLKSAFESGTTVNEENIADILGLPSEGRYSQEFAAHTRQSLRELFSLVNHGEFYDFVKGCDGSVSACVKKITQLPLFQDSHNYKGGKIGIYKRAQILAADLHLAFGHLGEVIFYDVDQLTMFADNAVPHVLNTDGILTYSDELSEDIANGTLLQSGSEQEIEIRACAAHVVEVLAKKMALRAMDVDHILWHRSSENHIYKASPTHLTLTTDY